MLRARAPAALREPSPRRVSLHRLGHSPEGPTSPAVALEHSQEREVSVRACLLLWTHVETAGTAPRTPRRSGSSIRLLPQAACASRRSPRGGAPGCSRRPAGSGGGGPWDPISQQCGRDWRTCQAWPATASLSDGSVGVPSPTRLAAMVSPRQSLRTGAEHRRAPPPAPVLWAADQPFLCANRSGGGRSPRTSAGGNLGALSTQEAGIPLQPHCRFLSPVSCFYRVGCVGVGGRE